MGHSGEIDIKSLKVAKLTESRDFNMQRGRKNSSRSRKIVIIIKSPAQLEG